METLKHEGWSHLGQQAIYRKQSFSFDTVCACVGVCVLSIEQGILSGKECR